MAVVSGAGTGAQELLSGDSVLEKLINQLSPDDRELVLRLMSELGIKPRDPSYPLLVAMQYYVSILRNIPQEMKGASQDALRQAITTYGTIQSQLDNSTTQVEAQTQKIDSIRTQWIEDTQSLLPSFKSAFDGAMSMAISAYNLKVKEISETALQEWKSDLDYVRNAYLKDVLKQGLIWASGVSLVAMLAIGGVAYWAGHRAAVQEFGDSPSYNFAKAMINYPGNRERFADCINNARQECSVPIVSSP